MFLLPPPPHPSFVGGEGGGDTVHSGDSHHSMHPGMIVKRHYFVGFEEKYPDRELGTLVHLHAGGRRVCDVVQVVPLLLSNTAREIEVF